MSEVKAGKGSAWHVKRSKLYHYNHLCRVGGRPALVDFPTPPFPEATAIMCLTSGIPSLLIAGPMRVA